MELKLWNKKGVSRASFKSWKYSLIISFQKRFLFQPQLNGIMKAEKGEGKKRESKAKI